MSALSREFLLASSTFERKCVESFPVVARLAELGFTIIATRGTAARLEQEGIACSEVNKIS